MATTLAAITAAHGLDNLHLTTTQKTGRLKSLWLVDCFMPQWGLGANRRAKVVDHRSVESIDKNR
jgi:hypothetical protein